jgi:hypothetical protein
MLLDNRIGRSDASPYDERDACSFSSPVHNPATAVQFQIDTPVASAQTDAPGEHRIAMLGGPSSLQTEMAIIRGSGALVTEAGTMPLRSGERSVAWDNAAPSRPQVFNSARYDAFDQWAMALRDQRLGARSQSAQYLPADLRMYGGELDRYGAWGYEAPYGTCIPPSLPSGVRTRRALVVGPHLRMDVDWRRCLTADAPLRPVGYGAPLVLDSGSPVVTCLGLGVARRVT